MGHDYLIIEPAVGETLEQRGIREEDIRQVLAVAQAGKRFLRQPATGRHLASFTPAAVTYWVEYGREGEGYRVFGAYSHRMRVLEGFNLPSRKEQPESGWVCGGCEIPLALATVKLKYLDETFAVDLPACPACQRVLISEEQAVKKMAMAERMLEDK